jgi:hypothetical protein
MIWTLYTKKNEVSMADDYGAEAIKDDDIREVYLRDIIDKTKRVRNRGGMTPLLYGSDFNMRAGFYHFDMLSNKKWRPGGCPAHS